METGSAHSKPLVVMKGIGKTFGSVRVLEGVDFQIFPGEVHLLVGENGAGKSTLIKILGGIHNPSEGTIFLNSKPFAPKSPLEANKSGISIIHQELSLIPYMTVMENFRLGHYQTRVGFVDFKSLKKETSQILEELAIQIAPEDLVEEVSLSQQQLLEIAKATSLKSKVIVMDEPSSALNSQDAEVLFDLIDKLKKRGCGIVYITHKMQEIDRLADRITVLRDGKFVSTGLKDEYTPRMLIQHMVGREMEEQFLRKPRYQDDEIFKATDFSLQKPDGSYVFKNINFSLRKGEVLGIGGLQGSGASELLAAIFGANGNWPTGEIMVEGRTLKGLNPAQSIREGIGFVTNDRKKSGLILSLSLTRNITLAALSRFCRMLWIMPSLESAAAAEARKTLSIRSASMDMEVRELSGGNQQKIVIAKWMQIHPKILLLDEPTRGIDVGAKWEIYNILENLTYEGVSIILITSELSELLSLSDRIVVMHRGHLVKEFAKDAATAESIIAAAMGNVGSGI